MPKRDSDDEAAVAKLLELKRKYKADCEAVESELTKAHQLEGEAREAAITQEYLDKVSVLIADRIRPLLLEVLKSE